MRSGSQYNRIFIFILVLTGCGKSGGEQTSSTDSTSLDSTTTETELPDPDWEYTELYGQYSHDASTSGFSSTLVLEPQGLNIAFTIISSKGESCRGEASGNIAMVNHNEFYDTGYWISDDCKLEFIFRHQDKKVDVREIHLCTLHEAMCGFEGTYSKIGSQSEN
jgi:hypothetical protein